MSMTRAQFIAAVKEYMDAESSNRWSPATITAVGGIVSQNEWSGIVNDNQYYRFGQRSVVTDAAGCIPIADLNSGSGDATQYFYRVLVGPTDGNILWRETDFRYVPLGTQANYTDPFQYVYYLQGDAFQLLPVQAGLALTVAVNWTPARIDQLASDSSTIIFPDGYEYILVWMTASTLLLKGGAESGAASDLLALADPSRKNMLGDIGRRTTRPTSALYQDGAASWGG